MQIKQLSNRRIIFVGIHNKPGFEPLDSRTASGKLIDKVIEQLDCKNVVKCNLFQGDYMPEMVRRYFLMGEWFQKYKPFTGDIVIVLGREAQRWIDLCEAKQINYRHPSKMRRKQSDSEYVIDLSEKINSLCR